jgi:hypothetical protein
MPNLEFKGHGTTGTKGNSDFLEFSAIVQGYTKNQEGFDLLVEDYGIDKIIEVINGVRSVTAVNGERTKLTAHKAVEKTQKANAFDELLQAKTTEERTAIMRKYDME